MSLERAPEKRELRRKLRALFKTMTDAEVGDASSRACALLRQQSVWKAARAVFFYAAMPGEINLSPLLEEGLRAGKIIALPRFMAETGDYAAFQIRDAALDCARGAFGITEPTAQCASFPLMRLDLALVPGVGFDLAGRRLGRGRGFYDRLLAQFSGIKCGVAFDGQLVERIPEERHDMRMNCILTPTRWLEIPGQV
ncbi:MAG: 5-formyltetrahydrofolate cyclo-ligase [Verrucomicrobiota bacterium]|jgi:5-formyltetrahydrofolate cyclo-ligase